MSLVIRPFREEDIERLAPVLSEIHETVVTAEAIRYEFQNIPAQIKFAYWVAEQDGELVGTGQYGQHLGAYHPRKFDVHVNVHPRFRRRGIGAALYDTMLAGVQTHEPIALGAGVREDRADAVRFAERRGFREVMRTWESHLDLTKPEPEQYAAVLDAVLAQGYTIKSYPELAVYPDWERKLHALAMEVRRDIPSSEPMTDVSFEEWAKGMQHPHFYPEGYFVAFKGDEWAGISTMRKTDEPGVLVTGITALRREHRGTGLAKALKVRALRQARDAGYKKTKTWNESNNQRMLKINEALGFVRQPAWVSYKLVLREE